MVSTSHLRRLSAQKSIDIRLLFHQFAPYSLFVFFSFRDTSVTLNLVPKVANPISQVSPWLPALGSSGHLPWHKFQPCHGDYQAKKKVNKSKADPQMR